MSTSALAQITPERPFHPLMPAPLRTAPCARSMGKASSDHHLGARILQQHFRQHGLVERSLQSKGRLERMKAARDVYEVRCRLLPL